MNRFEAVASLGFRAAGVLAPSVPYFFLTCASIKRLLKKTRRAAQTSAAAKKMPDMMIRPILKEAAAMIRQTAKIAKVNLKALVLLIRVSSRFCSAVRAALRS